MLTRAVLSNGDTLDYALGLRHGTHRGARVVSHGGAFVGFRAEMMRFPDHRLTVICLCNLASANPTRLAYGVADIYLDDQLEPVAPTEERGQVERDDEETETVRLANLAEFAGEYYSGELDVTYSLSLGGDTLRLQVGNDLDGELRPVAVDEMRRGGVILRFERDAQGAVSGFVLNAGRVKNLRFVRTSEIGHRTSERQQPR